MKKSILLTLGAIIIASVSLRGEDNNRGAWAVSIGPERLTETVEPEEFHYKDEERSFGQKVYDSSPLGHWDYLAPSDKIITAALPAVAALGGYQLYKYWNRKPEQTLEKDLTGVEKDLIKAKAIVRKEDDKMANKKSHVINTELYTELDRIQNDLEKVLDKINPKRPKKTNKEEEKNKSWLNRQAWSNWWNKNKKSANNPVNIPKTPERENEMSDDKLLKIDRIKINRTKD